MRGSINYQKFGQNYFVVDSKGVKITYSDLYRDVLALRSVIEEGLVFCFCQNKINSLTGYVAFIESDLKILMVDVNLDVDLIGSLVSLYHPNYVWLPDNEINKYNFNGKRIISLGEYSLVKINDEYLTTHKDLAILLPTSGSTGSPKFVRVSYDNLLSNAKSIANYLNINENERPVTSLPMHYSYGLSVINSHLISGATILMTEYSVMQKEFWDFVKKEKATSISGVPYTYEMLRRLRIFDMELPFLKTFTQAGGKLNPTLVKEYIQKALEKNKEFIVMYGQTEATARMSYLPFDKSLDKFSSIGIAIPDGEFFLINESGEEVTSPFVDGELVYKGPNVSLGYANCVEDLAKGDENNSILYTGDIAQKDEDGFFYITGRMKRFVKIYGNRVNLDELEQLLKNLVLSCACVGVDDHVTIFTTEFDKQDDIKKLLNSKTGINSRAFSVRHIATIPKNSSGKTQYSELTSLL